MKLLILTVLIVLDTSWAYDLKLFQATFRHGERAPKTTVYQKYYPKSVYANNSWYPEGPAGLTLEGKKTEYALGQWLRERYDDLLGDVWTSSSVSLRSDDSERVQMSAELVVAGLFPPAPEQTWNDVLAWQPIPYTYLPEDEDYLYNAITICNIDYINALEAKDETILAYKASLADFFANLTENTGANMSSIFACYSVYSQLRSELNKGLALADWASEEWVGLENGTLYNVTAFLFLLDSWDNRSISFYGGMWIKEFLDNVDSFVNGSSTQVAHLYSAHEGHVAATLIALNLFELHVPHYGSTVIFELYADDDKYYVKFVHKNKDTVKELVIPGCPCTYCPLETFRSLFAKVLLKDVKSACAEAVSSK